VDDQGNVYVVDFGNERIQKFAPGLALSGTLEGSSLNGR